MNSRANLIQKGDKLANQSHFHTSTRDQRERHLKNKEFSRRHPG